MTVSRKNARARVLVDGYRRDGTLTFQQPSPRALPDRVVMQDEVRDAQSLFSGCYLAAAGCCAATPATTSSCCFDSTSMAVLLTGERKTATEHGRSP